MPIKALGLFLKKHRLRKEFTKAELAEKANVSVEMIAAVERGSAIPGTEVLSRWSRALEIKIPSRSAPLNHRIKPRHARRGLGNFVTKGRLKLKLSQEAFAERVGMAYRSLMKLELGQVRPYRKTVRKISAVLGKIPARFL